MGEANGITRSPRVHSEMSNYDGATSWYEGGIPSTERLVLHAEHRGTAREDDCEWRLLTRRPGGEGGPAARFVTSGTVTETAVNVAPRANAGWMFFESPRLARHLRIFGSPRVKIWPRVERSWITYTPTLVDIDPAARAGVAGQQVTSDGKGVVSVTRGWLDSRYRNGLGRQQSIAPRGAVRYDRRPETSGLHLQEGPLDRTEHPDRDRRVGYTQTLRGMRLGRM